MTIHQRNLSRRSMLQGMAGLVIAFHLPREVRAQPAPAAGKQAPRIFISVQLFDGKMNMVFNKTVEGDAAAAETASLEVSLPALAKGVYDLVIEATDAVTRKNDLALFSLSVSKKGMQI